MNKIILAQIDTIAGDIRYNSSKIKEAIKKAKEKKAKLIIFPQLALFGSTFGDILCRHKSLVNFQFQELEEIKNLTNGITALIGYVEPTNSESKKPYYNSIAVFQDGKQILTARKKSCCYEKYFESCKNSENIFEINGEKFAIIIGEDEHIEKLADKRLSAIIHCASSPSRAGKDAIKDNLLSSIAKEYKINYIYVNQVGYGDNLCFDGASRIYNTNGELTLRGKSFEEDFIEATDYAGKIEDVPKSFDLSENFILNYENDLERTYKTIICGIRGYFNKTGFKKAVLGLSGGLDSSVCAVLLVDALGKENVYGISMPTKITSTGSKQDASILAKNLGITFVETPIANEFEVFSKELNQVFEKINTEKFLKSTTFENLQARTRATILWSIANEYKYMLSIATSDKSEAYIGYATTNGDMSGGFAPIADVTKTKLFALADYLNKNRAAKNVIPQSILDKPPGAELKFDKEKGRTVTAEEDNMPYAFLDEIIWLVENFGYGYNELKEHTFNYEKENNISQEQKESWILKFFDKAQKAIFKWHLMAPTIIVDTKSIIPPEYHHPIISKFSEII